MLINSGMKEKFLTRFLFKNFLNTSLPPPPSAPPTPSTVNRSDFFTHHEGRGGGGGDVNCAVRMCSFNIVSLAVQSNL